jgi:hypothetical protein
MPTKHAYIRETKAESAESGAEEDQSRPDQNPPLLSLNL